MKEQPVEQGQPGGAALSDWETLVVEAVGDVIEYWGFKANEGRVWALLYLHGRPFSAAEIGRSLRLSKGAVSMVTREMEAWGVLRRVRGGGASVWRYEAETDFIEMIRRVLTTREARFVARVKADLLRAEQIAKNVAPAEVVERIARMRALAALVERAVGAFLRTARFDVTGALGILTGKRPLAAKATAGEGAAAPRRTRLGGRRA